MAKTLTLQQIFNRAVKGLAEQTWEQSKEKDGEGMYRGKYGRACAIGHCLTDSELRDSDGKSYEGAIEFLPQKAAVKLGIQQTDVHPFGDYARRAPLQSLQSCHDDADMYGP